MRPGKSSAPSAAAEAYAPPPARAVALAALSCLLAVFFAAAAVQAQQPVLRVGGAEVVEVAGNASGGGAAFPAATLERLGFRLVSAPGSLAAAIDGDTLRFWPTSPYFRRGAAVHQLTAPVTLSDGVTYLPEQFYIQWLPAAFPDRFEFRGGILVMRGAASAAAPAPPPPAAAAGAAVQAPPAAANRAAQPPPAQRQPARRSGENRVVIIDPGHGGRDPGKVGPNGLMEKDVTLMVSQRLATVLRERGYEVHLTRTTDTLISLADRPRLANTWRGDRTGAVFLSIHANSAVSTSARGFETFFLSEAQTDDERRVAQMENEAIRFEDAQSRQAFSGLEQILNSLRSEFLTRASHDLAATIQQRLATFHPGPNRGVKRAGFYVLVGAIMPAVLVETAFISNRDEASLLGTQSFQQNLAWGIADGVDEFFRRNEHLWMQGH
jgi:N-acetylmuramoyl-L-alanine amidase